MLVENDIGSAVTSRRDSRMSYTGTDIIDIRRVKVEHNILNDVRSGLRPGDGKQKSLPTLLLYDEAGLKLFEKITYLDEYYLTNAEIEVLERYATNIADRIQPGSVLVELGSGNLRKVNILLQAIEKQQKDVEYYALDLSVDELERTLSEVPLDRYKHVKFAGLHGTYDDGFEWLKSPQVASRPKTVLWLGSSVGNFDRDAAAQFLRNIGNALRPGDRMVIGIDSCKKPERVYHAYNDRHGVTHQFILNGLRHANRLFGQEVFRIDDWKVIGEYDTESGRHHAFVTPLRDVVADGVPIRKGERVKIEESYKYSEDEIERLWEASGFVEGAAWACKRGDYALHMVSKPRVSFPVEPEKYASKPVPTLSDWEQLWKAWDTVTRDMIPDEELLEKPIKLRNACIFYLGHIPTFLDIHISRATDSKYTEPSSYTQIFERGIDPDVDNPEQCHAHSEIPDTWPPVDEVLDFQRKVRERVKALYSSPMSRRVEIALFIGYEHEIMHLETLLYMLIQSEKTLPPPDTIRPDFEALSQNARANAVENQWFKIPEAKVEVGYDQQEGDFFGWDNEKPRRVAHVKAFEAKARPITNGEFADYLDKTGATAVPASWIEEAPATDGSSPYSSELNEGIPKSFHNKSVRTVYGPIPLKYALEWPVVASYDELVGCARWMGGRIPSMEEARSIYEYVEAVKQNEVEKVNGKTIPAVNGHLVSDGVEESPPSQLSNGEEVAARRQQLFLDMHGRNIGFKHWHPVPVVQNGEQLAGQGDFGGVWEWTSSTLEKWDGFAAMKEYPGYTSDFFDGKHNIVLGGSWATHPRIAGRKTFVNWYQRNYPYVWAGARVVRDL